MKRRALIIAAGTAVVAMPFSVWAQPRKPPVVIGWLDAGSPETSGPYLTIFKEAMTALERREGMDVTFELRWAQGNSERLRGLAAELADRKPAVIVVSPRTATVAVAKAAPGIPIVQASGGSLVAVGLAANLARPGGNVTGLVGLTEETSEKNTEIVLDIFPKAQRIGYLVDTNGINRGRDYVESARRTASRRNVQADFVEVAKADELQFAFEQFRKIGVQAVVLLPNAWFGHERACIMRLGLSHRLPVIGIRSEQAEAGALVSYGFDRAYNFRRAAWYVDQILKGVKPGDLPIEQPANFELVVNLKTAKALGITIPPVVMVPADRVIQ